MDYARIYREFIADRRAKEAGVTGLFDTHHILPRHFGGDDSAENLVRLKPTDHLFAHLLLARIHGGSMVRALYGMMRGKRYKGRKSRYGYAWLRDAASEEMSLKVREANKKRGHGVRLGIKHTPEAIEKMRQNRRGIPRNKESVEKSAQYFRGRKQSPEHVAKRIASKMRTLEARKRGG